MSFADDLKDIAAGKVEAAPPSAAPRATERAPVPNNSAANSAEATAKAGAEAFWGQVERNANAGGEILSSFKKGEVPTPLTLLRAAMKTQLPTDVVRTIFGTGEDFYRGLSRKVLPEALLPPKETPEQFVERHGKGSDMRFEGELTDRFVGEVPKGGAITEYLLKPMARGVGAFGGFPVPGAGPSVAKNLVMSAGAGEGSDLGSKIGGGLGKAVGGETGQTVGEVAGGLAGGAAGAQANVTRMQGMGKVADKGMTVSKAVGKALSPEKGDTRSFFTRLQDNFKTFEDTKARTYYDQIVASRYAESISKAPGADKNLASFKRMAEEAGIDASVLTPAQQTMAPALVEKQRYFEPANKEQVAGRAAQEEKLHSTMGKVYEEATGRKVGAQSDINLSVNRLRQHIVDELSARETEAGKVMDESPKTAPHITGADTKVQFEQEKLAAQEQFNKLYSGTHKAADSAGITVNVEAASKKALKDLSEVEAKALPKIGYELSHVIDAAQAKDWKLSFKESHDLVKALGKEARAAEASGDTGKLHLLDLHRKRLLGAMQEATLSKVPHIWGQFEGINNAYRDKFIPRFSEGIAANLDRDAGRTRSGQDYYRDEEVFSKGYLGKVDGKVAETNMAQFDKTFGEELGGQRNEAAFNALRKAVETDYVEKVYNGSKGREFDLNKHKQFMNDYKAAFRRVPEVAAKLDDQAARIQGLKDRAELAGERWSSVLGKRGSLTETLGQGASNMLVSKALADPRVMGKIINRLGVDKIYDTIMARLSPMIERNGVMEYDPVGMLQTLQAGAGPSGQGLSSIQLLMRSKWGKEAGDKHYNNLKTIGSIALREMQTSPRFAGGESLVRPGFAGELTGQSAASWVALGRNLETGRAGKAWAFTQAGSRFMRGRILKGLQEAEYRAMFDPKYSEAVKDMAQTSMNEAIKASTAKALDTAAKAGGDLFDELVNRGFVRGQVARGGALGGSMAVDRERDREAEAEQREQARLAQEAQREAAAKKKKPPYRGIIGSRG